MYVRRDLITCCGLAVLCGLLLIAFPIHRQAELQLEKQARLRQPAAEWNERSGKPNIDFRVAELVERLPDVRGQQPMLPGCCLLIECGKGTAVSDELVGIGRPAIPVLVEHLDDVRPTQSQDAESDHKLLVQDVVIQCIERIVGIPFHDLSQCPHLSDKTPERCDAVIRDIREWWSEYGGKSELQGYLGRLSKGGLYQRLAVLETIERLDPSVVDSIALLKDWVRLAGWQFEPRVAEELARRGDLSELPRMRAIVRNLTIRIPVEIPSDAIVFLVKHGDASDIRFLRAEALRDFAVGSRSGKWGAVYGGARAYPRPLVVPILVDFLDRGEFIVSRGSDSDDCMATLLKLTAHNEGYDRADDSDRRLAAIDRWLKWWDIQGRTQYLRQHPEVKGVMLGE